MNPIYGSVGLLWSGNWQLCQNAVEAVLKGAPIIQIATEAAETNNGPPLKAYDIRHVSKNEKSNGSGDLHRVRTRCRFKRSSVKPKASKACVGLAVDDDSGHDEENRSTSHESSLSHQSEAAAAARNVEGESRDTVSLASDETTEAEVLERVEEESALGKDGQAEVGEIELELTLGYDYESVSRAAGAMPKQIRRSEAGVSKVDEDDGVCRMELGLDYSA